ncbi:MAG: FtsW/RodA/SpoVE family cell cycle protein [Planctomycetaceae bacterium]
MRLIEQTFLAFAGLLLAIGLLMVFSASMTSEPSLQDEAFLRRQLASMAVALLAGLTGAMLPAACWRRAAPWMLLAVMALLLGTLMPTIGTRINGARRWLRVGPFNVQPSELAKIVLPLFVCRMAATGGWRGDGMALLGIVVTLGLVVAEPDLGTTLFLALTSGVALWLSGWPLKRFVIAAGLGLPVVASIGVLRPYQLQRLQGFLASWHDVDAASYQVKQSLVAIGSGGVFGSGLGNGQQKLSFLPEANTDFVYAVIGEELGLLGTLGVLMLFVGLYLTGLRLIASLRRGSFEHSASLTLLTGLVLQAGLNMAVVVALAPPKGISLPLVSYGGSNLVVSAATLGLVLSFARSTPAPAQRTSIADAGDVIDCRTPSPLA